MEFSRNTTKVARIKEPTEYFEKKYGDPRPIVAIEGTDKEVWGKSWDMLGGLPAVIVFAMRLKELPTSTVYYSKVGIMGECVMENELGKMIPVAEAKDLSEEKLKELLD